MLIDIMQNLGNGYQFYRSLMFDAGGYIFAWEQADGRMTYIESWLRTNRIRKWAREHFYLD